MKDNIKENNQNQGEMMYDKLLKALNQNADAVIELFHPEAIIEFPYAVSLGTASKMNFKEWHNYLKGGLPNMPNIHFDNARVYEINKNTYWAEVHGETKVPSTNKMYIQDWVMHFTLKDDKFNFYKEYWNPSVVTKAFGGEEAMKKIFNTDK